MKSDSEDSVVSIHSIVTDNQNFDSDNEAPEDKIGDVHKIVKNHVLKEILIPSKSFIKPGNNDLITINYICYINKEDILEEKTTRVYLRKLPVCKGLVQAILHMRLNETARVTIYPKYGYRKYNEKSGYDLPEKIRNKSDDLLENLRKATLFYEISLKEVVKMYDLTGKGEMMKYILTSGKGLLKPKEKDQVNFSLKVMLDSEIVININEERRLDETHLNQCEVIMIKSMKKGETSKIEILPSYLNQFDSNILNNKKFNNNTRIIYELTLIDFIENNERFTKKGKLYQVFIINKGIGNICPWRNCSLRVRFKILHNDKELYSTFDVAIDESERLKKIKTTIKKVPNHLNIVNFLLDKTIYEEDLKTDLINLNFKLIPSEVFETIIAMRPLEYSRITFKDLDYFKINDFELIDLKGDLTVFINVLDFVNNDIFASLSPEERLTNILLYKNNGNYLFKLNLLHKAKSNYKYIINEFEKEYNLIKNKKEVSSNIYTTEVKKVYFNIINCHIKLNNLILAQEIIKKYLECFDENDEKILYLKMTVFKLKNEEENLLQTAEKLNNLFPKEEYINLIKSTKEKLLKNEKDKKKLMKKLIKNI